MKLKSYDFCLHLMIIFLLFFNLVLQLYGITIPGSSLHTPSEAILKAIYLSVFFSSLAAFILYIAKERIAADTRKKAYMDITGVKNKFAFADKLTQIDQYDTTYNIAITMFDLNNLKTVNDQYGHEAGDLLISGFADILIESAGKDFTARTGGDEFVLISENTTKEQLEQKLLKLEQLAQKYNLVNTVPICYAYGSEISTEEEYYVTEELCQRADQKMYQNKRNAKEAQAPAKGLFCDCLKKNQEGIDSLTGLLTIESFTEKFRELLRNSHSVSDLYCICCDISNFHYINDTYNYQTGNRILQKFAENLRLEPGFLLGARLFSDNYVYLIRAGKLNHTTILPYIRTQNRTIMKKVLQLHNINNFMVNAGICHLNSNTESPEEIISHASIAKKYAKKDVCHLALYSSHLRKLEANRSEVLQNFEKAMQDGELQVYLQPQIVAETEIICGAEALIRWVENGKTVRTPDEFIPFLEESGDIVTLDFYVYEQVFKWISTHLEQNNCVYPISLNVSRIHLNDISTFIQQIKTLLHLYAVPVSLIKFEITESAYIQNFNQAGILIDHLHQIGIRVSMDDFGSGYSSLTALKDLSFDEIKIDKQFLSDGLTVKEQDILQEIIHMIQKTRKMIVCEGVETFHAIEFLRKEGCDIVQGYYYSKPIPISEFENKYCF